MFDGVVDEAKRKDERQHSEEYGDSWDDDQLYTVFGTTLEDIPDKTDIEDENALYRRLRRIIEPYGDRGTSSNTGDGTTRSSSKMSYREITDTDFSTSSSE